MTADLHPAVVAGLKTTIDNLLTRYPELVEDEILRADMFEAESDLHRVVERLLSACLEAETMMSAINERMTELGARYGRYERRMDAMRSLIASIMEHADLKKLTLPEATLSMSWRKPSPIIINEAALPDECTVTMRKAVMAKVKEWIDRNGDTPPGVAMSNGRNVLTIRTK